MTKLGPREASEFGMVNYSLLEMIFQPRFFPPDNDLLLLFCWLLLLSRCCFMLSEASLLLIMDILSIASSSPVCSTF